MNHKHSKSFSARNKVAVFKTPRTARQQIWCSYAILLLHLLTVTQATGPTILKKNADLATSVRIASPSIKQNNIEAGILHQIITHQPFSTHSPNSEVFDETVTNTTILQNPFYDKNDTDQFWCTNDTSNNSTLNRNTAESEGLYDVPISLVVGMSFCYAAISVIGVFGNLLVLWVVADSQRMRTKTNIFIANLAVSDVIIGVFAIPFQFQAALLQRWDLPDIMCKFCPFVQVLSVNASVFTLAAIALDRYRAILYPFRAIQTTKREISMAVSCIWCVSILLALPQAFDFNVTQVDDGQGGMKDFCAPNYFSPTFRIYYNLSLVVLQYVFPLSIVSVAYAIMAKKLWGHTIPGNVEATRDMNALRSKKKVVKMLLWVVILFAMCWLPLQLYNFLQWITNINEYKFINIIWFCFHWLAMSNSCCNPIIYAICSEKFQQEFRQRLPFLQKQTKDSGDTATDNVASDMEMCHTNQGNATDERCNRLRDVLKMNHGAVQSTIKLGLDIISENPSSTEPAIISPAFNRIFTNAAVTVQYSNTCSKESTT